MDQLSRIARASFLALLALSVAWELWLAPSAAAIFWFTVKVAPLLAVAPGVLAARRKALFVGCLVVLIHFCEGVVIAYAERAQPLALDRPLLYAWLEIALALVFFFSASLYLRAHRPDPNRAETES